MKVAGRTTAITPFYAMEVLKAANERAAQGGDVLHMEVGEPAGGAPPQVLEAAQAVLKSGKGLGYTEALGVPGLRHAISAHYKSTAGLDVDPGHVVVTTGSSGGFLLAFLAAFDPGDRVALASPGYPAYRNIMAALGIEAVDLPSDLADRFQPTPALLDKAIAQGGKLDGLLIASPANPTGTMLDHDALSALVDYCQTRDIRIISDEVYHGITYGDPAETIVALDPHAIAVNSFSKYFAMTGWRLGWMVLPDDLVRPVERLAQNLFISPPSLSQLAAIAAFDAQSELDAKVAAYAKNRALLLKELPLAGFDKLAPADGAFYIFADVRHLTNDSADFCKRMLAETGVAATPGIDFDPDRGHAYVRFSFAGAHEDMVKAVDSLKAWTPL
jgi:aspartate/methionine/tyrosine aminotransferase